MKTRYWRLVSAVVVVVVALALSPTVRAEIGKMFGWYSFKVQPAPQQHATSETGQTKPPQYDSTVSYRRETSGQLEFQTTTQSLEKAREFLGSGAALPPILDGQEMLLYREVDKEGKPTVIGLSAPTVHFAGSAPSIGFWVRYRPAGDHRIGVTYGNDFRVSTEDREINGRSARLVWVDRVSGKIGPAELWLDDGNWVYEMREDRGQMESLIKIAETLR